MYTPADLRGSVTGFLLKYLLVDNYQNIQISYHSKAARLKTLRGNNGYN